MTADQFSTNFGHVAMAPSGVKRLRELVLHLAVSGCLVPRKLNEGEGAASIAEASTLKDAYRAKLELRPSGSDRPLAQSELAFKIPVHWKWERLSNIACYIQRGKGPKYDDAGKIRVVSQKCVQWTGFDLSSARRISDDSASAYSHERFLVSGDILWNSTGTGTAGRLALYPGAKEQVVADSHVTIIRLTNFLPAYVWCYLVSPTIQQRMIPGHENSMVTGTTNQVELSAAKVSDLPIPCAPLAEQKRIVARVDELMVLCDQLETQQQERERRFPVLSRTCHARFAEAPTPTNLNRIFDETGAVSPDDLRNTILSLAVRGRLISQNSKDEPIEDCSKTPSARKLQPITKEELPFSLPRSWQWCRLGSVAQLINGDRGRNYPNKAEYVRAGLPFINTGHIEPNGTLSIATMHYITRAKFDSLRSGKIQDGDLVYCLRGATIGKTAIITQFEEGAVASSLVIIRLNKNLLPRYAYYFLISPAARSLIKRFDNGSAQPNLAAHSVKLYVTPVPPLAEQRRIVAKVDELMVLVNHLEAQQQERDKLAESFAKTCVASFTGTTQLGRPEKMKAPKTELVSFVTVGKKPKPDDKAPLAHLLNQAKGTLPAKALWQQSGLTIDAFYQQLKTELAEGWIAPPQEAEMKVMEEPKESAYTTLTPALAARDVGGEAEDVQRVKPKSKRS